MDWMQITVLTTTEGADLVSELLMRLGSEGTMIEDRNDVFANQRPEGQWDIIDEAIAERIGEDVRVTGYYPVDDRLSDTIAQVRAETARLKAEEASLPLGKLEVQTQGLADEDWTESWKKAFHPIRLGAHFVVKPGWTEAKLEPGDKVIEIDPGMAFGTGTHATTGMCTALVERYVKAGMRVIDIGTGSGILAIAAAHMGAGRVIATDLDAVAVRVAGENAAINGFSDVIEMRCGDLLDVVHETGDVVVANIIADVIIMLAGPVRQVIEKNGLFICSGIAIDRREDVRRALEQNGFTLLDDPVQGEWAAFAARRGD
ncbi:MAG: 50S ribosomal protein L11 methyltransferase [Clostridiales bacterium]|nr:50S ribosomal protein L11 methyltransferase [Clostridiales bacterium]